MDATSMMGKTMLFTGASRGVGRVAAIEMARRGAEILIVGHDEARGARALAAVRAVGRGEFLLADMADAGSVRQLAGRVLARTGGLHVLLHNAGGFPPAGRRTADGRAARVEVQSVMRDLRPGSPAGDQVRGSAGEGDA